MHRNRLLLKIFLLTSVFIAGGCSLPQDRIRFYTNDWLEERPFGYSIASSVDELGAQIYKFEWRRDDLDSSRRTKGTELKSRPMPGLSEQEASFEFFAPAEFFSNDSKFAIIMQYHSVPDTHLGEEWRNPISDLVIRNGYLQYDFRASADSVTPKVNGKFVYTSKGSIELGRLVPNTWNRVTIYQHFDFYDGRIRIALNDQIFEKGGVGVGFNDKDGAFFKFGLYCPEGSDMSKKIIFFRNIELRSTSYDKTNVSDKTR